MASIVNAQHATIIGTPEQLMAFLGLLSGGATIVNMTFANLVVLNTPVTREDIAAAIVSTPQATAAPAAQPDKGRFGGSGAPPAGAPGADLEAVVMKPTRSESELPSAVLKFGEVFPGWSVSGCIEHLRHMAHSCRDLHPEQADEYERWAETIERKAAGRA